MHFEELLKLNKIYKKVLLTFRKNHQNIYSTC